MDIPPKHRWWMLGALCLAVLVLSLDFTVLNVALPTISSSLGAGTTDLQWIVDAYSLAIAGAMLPVGVLGDRFGRKRVILIGLSLFLVGSLIAALSTAAAQLITARVVMGLGAAIILPITPAMIVTAFSGPERTRAMGLFTAAVGAGMPFGPILGGVLLQHYSWNSVFWINVPVLAVALVAGLLFIGESRNENAPTVDLLGATLSVVGLVGLVYGMIHGPQHGWGSATTVAIVTGSLGVLAAFIVWEHHAEHPLVDPTLFRRRRFTANAAATMIVSLALTGVMFVVPLYLQVVRGHDALGTGIRIIPMMGGLMVAGAFGASANRILGTKVTVATGLAMMASGLVVLAQIGTATDFGWLAVGLAGCGGGVGIVMSVAMEAAISTVDSRESGAASSAVNTLRQLASAIAVAGLGSVLSSIYSEKLQPALTGLPDTSVAGAKDSLVGAVTSAARLGRSGTALAEAAKSAYVEGMSAVMWCCGILAVCGIAITLVFVPNNERTALSANGSRRDDIVDAPADTASGRTGQ